MIIDLTQANSAALCAGICLKIMKRNGETPERMNSFASNFAKADSYMEAMQFIYDLEDEGYEVRM